MYGETLETFISKLSSVFTLKDLGILSYFLGIEVFYMSDGLHLSQKKYIRDLLVKAQMTTCKSSDILFCSGLKLEKLIEGELGQCLVDPTMYRSLVGGYKD